MEGYLSRAVIGRVLAGTLGLVAATILAAVPVMADGGPHVASINSGATTLTADSCAGCHRAHTALGEMLLKTIDESSLCLTCHGSAATGSTSNVIDGVQAGTALALKGGGFVNALMDTAWTGAAVSRPATSAHLFDGTTQATMWGAGAIGSGPGTTPVTLGCTSCHNPHGNGQYRILRPIPVSAPSTATAITVPDETTKRYVVASPENRYFGEKYGEGTYNWEWQYQLDQWCAACHTRYDAYNEGDSTTGPGHTPSGDPIFKYRHMTRYSWDVNCALCHPGSNGINADDPFGVGYETAHEATCENCHVAHGSAAIMGTYSGTVPWPDSSTTPSGNARSSLLRLDNRGICIGCHDPTD